MARHRGPARGGKRKAVLSAGPVQLVEPVEEPEVRAPACIACRFQKLPGDKAFLGGVAVARLFGDPRTSRALTFAFTEDMCAKHKEELSSLKDLKLLHLSEAIVAAYGSRPSPPGGA